jgi:hypothetical protein
MLNLLAATLLISGLGSATSICLTQDRIDRQGALEGWTFQGLFHLKILADTPMTWRCITARRDRLWTSGSGCWRK